jgi:hypothetical protein
MYFPWVGFFQQMALADAYVWLDDAQFSKGSYTNRIQVKLPGGRKWMTVPLAGHGTHTLIGELAAAGTLWQSAHRSMLVQSLRGTPHLDEALRQFDEAIRGKDLCDLLIRSAEIPALYLGCRPQTVLRSSHMGLSSRSSTRVLDIVKALGGDRYVTGHGAAQYLDHEAFDRAGIAVEYMQYGPEPWPQAHGDFSPFVTVLDLIAAAGDTARQHLRPRTVPWRAFMEVGRVVSRGDD